MTLSDSLVGGISLNGWHEGWPCRCLRSVIPESAIVYAIWHNYRRISGIQEKSGNPLDTGSRPPQSDSSGMTGSANCDIVSNERGDFFGTKLIGVIENSQENC